MTLIIYEGFYWVWLNLSFSQEIKTFYKRSASRKSNSINNKCGFQNILICRILQMLGLTNFKTKVHSNFKKKVYLVIYMVVGKQVKANKLQNIV